MASKNNDSGSHVRHSIKILMIRHAESRNNEVYRNARYIYRGGTKEFDLDGWNAYVDTHRSADPGLSEVGTQQADHLADYLVPYLQSHAESPLQIICSPMRRTLATIRPTVHKMINKISEQTQQSPDDVPDTQVLVHAFYFESEGCHTKDKPESGMSPAQIHSMLVESQDNADHSGAADGNDSASQLDCDWLQFVGFPNINQGWYAHGTGPETRAESEIRAAKFYMWLLEHLDQQLMQLASSSESAVDPSATTSTEQPALQRRKRCTTLLVGHGDFMSLVLKRIVAGFGHAVENEGIPHRSAFVHFNTGITELEYFGKGRFLIMSQNHTPHFAPDEYDRMRTGGSLKDGWSYLMPNDEFLLDAEVSVAFSDELENHVVEQATALKALYMSSKVSDKFHSDRLHYSVERQDEDETEASHDRVKHFIVKQGLQVVGVASYSELTGRLFDVAVRPSAGPHVSETLFDAVKRYSKKLGRSGSLLITPRSTECKALFEAMGFEELDDSISPDTMQLKHYD